MPAGPALSRNGDRGAANLAGVALARRSLRLTADEGAGYPAPGVHDGDGHAPQGEPTATPRLRSVDRAGLATTRNEMQAGLARRRVPATERDDDA